ncbi:MAG TPA: GDP-mannose 4,6-dehydratase [Chitinophagaceae bacterium]|nr:GDP-mannose 4,6-dehydratase [Chitinophagaceae bacterium]
MKALIFGINGQDGYYLNKLLKQQQYEVTGVSRSGDFLRTDITSYSEVSALIKALQPQFIFHLAANSTTRHDVMFENHGTISTGTLNILEAVKTSSPQSKVFISGSGLQFKNENKPIKESDAFEARDAYSVSRIHSVYAARYYRTLGIKAYVGYFFNHDSPLRSERHVTKKITETVKRIASGSSEPLEIGDTSVIKEWTFAGDVVNAIWTLIRQDNIFEANLGSGKGYSIQQWIEVCFTLARKNWQEYVVHKAGFVPEYHKLVCNPSLIHAMGWAPRVSFEDLAAMMINT